jgi:hypothetical protein
MGLAIVSLSLFLLTAPAPAAGPETDPSAAALPGTALEVLGTEFPELALAGASHFDAALLETLDPRPARLEELGRAWGDLDGDGSEDWALLLTGPEEHLVVVLLGRGQEAWQVHVLSRRRGPLPAAGSTWLRIRPGEGSAAPDLLEMGSGGRTSTTTWDRGRPVTHAGEREGD